MDLSARHSQLANEIFQPEEWMLLIKQHIQARPAMEVQDIYKLLFQGICGAEHSMPSLDMFVIRLHAELASLKPVSGEPSIEVIRHDNRLRRINLRPYVAITKDIDWLVEVCLKTGMQKWGTEYDLVEIWQAFLSFLDAGYFPTINKDKAKSFHTWIRDHNFPVVHHSKQYTKVYNPAYRLVAEEYLMRGEDADFV